ncbi:MAG: hypothetical protein QNJ57_13240 [Flavobacteriaceae bacterium]|nr:hypothetical protein [Flavobacteriaceae bacterium]
MKRLKLITALFLTVLFFSSFTEVDKKEFKHELHDKITTLIGTPGDQLVERTIRTEVYFTFNNKQEIVVLSVATEDYGVDSFLKRKLNYKKVNLQGVTKGAIYKLPVTIKKIDS